MVYLNSSIATSFFKTNLPLLFGKKENGKHLISAKGMIVLRGDQKIFQWTSDEENHETYTTVEFFKNALEVFYGKKQTKTYCKFLGFNLSEMAKKSAPLKAKTARRIISGMAQITDITCTFADHYSFLRQAETVKQLGQKALDEQIKTALQSSMLGELKSYSLERLINDGLVLYEELKTKSISSMTAETFQKVHDFLNPIKAMLRDQALSMAQLPIPKGVWDKISFGLECLGMSSRKKVLVFEIAEAIKQIEELPQENYSEKMEGYREVLARYIAYSEASEGALIPAPLENGRMGYYKVAKQVITGKGMVAYVLTRATDQMKELVPIVLFRGTALFPSSLDSCSSVLTYLELNAGSRAYNSGRKKLFEALQYEGILKADPRLEVIGYSLGGIFAQKFVLDFTSRLAGKTLHHAGLEGVKKIDMFLFNSPAIDKKSNLRFKRLIEQKRLELIVGGCAYLTRGDMIQLGGSRYLVYGCDRTKVPFIVKFCSGNNIVKHSASFFNKRGMLIKNRKIVTICEEPALNRALINKGFKAFLMQLLRYSIGFLVYLLTILPYLTKRLICGWRRPTSHPYQDMEAINQNFRKDSKRLLQLLALPEGKKLNNPKVIEWLDEKIVTYYQTGSIMQRLEKLQKLSPSVLVQKVLFKKIEPALKNQFTSFPLPEVLLLKLKNLFLEHLEGRLVAAA